MATAQETLTKQVMKWPARRRLRLAEELVASVESFATRPIEEAWNREIGARLEDIRTGRAEEIPAEQAMAAARRRLHEARRLPSTRRKRTG